MLGIPQENKSGERALRGNIFSINGARLRAHGFMRKVAEKCGNLTSAAGVYDVRARSGRILPWWIYNVTDIKRRKDILRQASRWTNGGTVWEHAMLYYDEGLEPVEKHSGAILGVLVGSCGRNTCLHSVCSYRRGSCRYVVCAVRPNFALRAAAEGVCLNRRRGENRVASQEQVQKQGVVKRTVKYFKLHG